MTACCCRQVSSARKASCSPAHLAAYTERLKFLVAIRPGTASPAYYARLAMALDRVSTGRSLLNIVVGGNPSELAGDGIFQAA